MLDRAACGARATTLLSVATLILYFAYTGQAWNVMMGFAGQLSLGHSLYVGVGAYAAGGAVLPLRHRPVGRAVGWRSCSAWRSALIIGFLAFRFGISGVYFALLTIAFAEFTRIGFDHLDWLGGPGGLFLKVAQRDTWTCSNFRGPPLMYYYAMLCSAAARACAVRWLLRSRAGYYWQAIRENEEAAQALGINTFRWKMLAVAISSAMTAVVGRVLRLLLQQPVPRADLPHQPLDRDHPRPDHRRHRHAVRPDPRRRGADRCSPTASPSCLAALGWEIPGIKQVFYGVVLLVVIMFLPHGIWPPLAQQARMS